MCLTCTQISCAPGAQQCPSAEQKNPSAHSLNIFNYVLFFIMGTVHTRAVWKYKLYLAERNSSEMYDCVLPPNQHFVSVDKISTTEEDYKLWMQQGSCDLKVRPFWAAFPLIPSEHTHKTQSKCISVLIEQEILCSSNQQPDILKGFVSDDEI